VKKFKILLPFVISIFLIAVMVLSGCPAAPTVVEETTPTPEEETTPEEEEEEPVKDPALEHAGIEPSGGVVDTSGYKREGPYTIGWAGMGMLNTWLTQNLEEFLAEAESRPEIGDVVETDSAFDLSKQISDCEDLIAMGVDAIIINALSPEALNEVLRKALEKGVVVIAMSSPLNDPSVYTSWVGFEEERFGYITGKWLVEAVGKGEIIALGGMEGHTCDTRRRAGLEQAIEESGGDVTIVQYEPCDWAYDKAKLAMEDLLIAYPDIDGLWSQGGEMSVAAIEAFEEKGLPLVPITGEDFNGYLRMWKERLPQGFTSIGYSTPTWISRPAVELAIRALKGEPMYKNNTIIIDPVLDGDIDKWIRPDLADGMWVNTELSEEKLKELFPIE